MADDASLENLSPEDRDNLARLAHGLANDPKTRGMFLRLTKAHAPNTVIPELDVLESVATAVTPHLKKIEAMEAEQIKRDVKERIREKRDELRDEGYSKEEIDSIEKVMVERQIPSHKTAAEFYKLQRQTAAPTPSNYSMTKIPMPNKDQIKESGSAKRHFIADAHKAVDDLRNGKIRLH